MDYYPFPALLRSDYNYIHEFGQASPAPQGDAVNFTGDFVPLIPLGTAAAIQWVLGEKTIATFRGKVYLSTSEMMQLVEVDPGQVEKLRAVFAVNTNLPGSITAGTRRAPLKTKSLPVDILYLSPALIKLRASQYVEEGSSILLSSEVDFLTLRDLELTIKQRLLLRRGESLLLCSVESGGSENYIALSAYAAKLAKNQPAAEATTQEEGE